MATTEDKLETLFAKVRALPKARQQLAVEALSEIADEETYTLSDDEHAVLVVARRAQKTPPLQGGWNMFHNYSAGVGTTSPATMRYLRTTGDDAWFGWPKSEQVEVEVAAWHEAKNA